MNTELSNDEPVADGYRLIIKYFYQKSIKDGKRQTTRLAGSAHL